MRRIIKTFILALMSSEATAYDLYQSMEDEWNRTWQVSEMQRIEQRDKKWRHCRLELERYRSEWR